MKKEVIIQLKDGLEARPIALLVQTANQYASQIYLEMQDKRVNAKSIMGMMSLALFNGEKVTIDAQGTDEISAIEALEAFLR